MRPLPEDTDATAELPQLDIRVLSAMLERVNEPDGESSTPHGALPEWQRLDEFAGLRDRIAHLEILRRESEAQYSRLMARHEALQKMLGERDLALIASQGELQLLRTRIEEVATQRQQRDQFIVKQAQEIRRLRSQFRD